MCSTLNVSEPLMIVAKQLEDEEMEGMQGENELDFVSQTFLLISITSPETTPKTQQPVPKTSLPTELVVPAPSQVPELEGPIPTRPIVLATTLGPIRPPSPPHLGPMALPLQSLELTYPPPHDYLYHIGVPTIPSGRHEFVFEPNYVLAYGPFDVFNPMNPNDPSGRPIDHCVYLYPMDNLAHEHISCMVDPTSTLSKSKTFLTWYLPRSSEEVLTDDPLASSERLCSQYSQLKCSKCAFGHVRVINQGGI